MSRLRRSDEGSIAVLAAITVPVVLLCVALATAVMVWSSSENEAQRAADTAAVRAAATAFLGADFPYEQIPGATTPVTYPDVQAIAAAFGQSAPHNLDACGTVGLPPSSTVTSQVPAPPSTAPPTPLPTPTVPSPSPPSTPESITYPADCTGVGPFDVAPPLLAASESRAVACSTAYDAMAPDDAPYANGFYQGGDATRPSCTADPSTGQPRVTVKVATGSPLVGFGQYATDQATGALDTRLVPQFGTIAQILGAFGIHLDTSLPSLLCPEVNVAIDQPVREPVFDKASTPNGRATARRIAKNAVIVPVYQGQTIPVPSPGDDVRSAASGTGVDATGTDGVTVNIPPVNLNALLLSAQQQLVTLLDEVDAIADAAIRAGQVTVDYLNGTFTGIDPTQSQREPVPGVEPAQGLRITKCLRDTVQQIYDPPSGDAPTPDEVLKDAAANGDEVIAIQVGAVRTACTTPGAIETTPAPNVVPPGVTPTDECIAAATTPRYDAATGVYEVPFFDATPVLVHDVGNHNYEAVPVHASQAAGAFRAALVRAPDDDRYDATLDRTPAPPACLATIPASPPTTACDVLSVSPSPLPSTPLPTAVIETLLPPSESPTSSPSESPSSSPSENPLPVPLPLPPSSSSPSPTPTPTPTPSPTPTSTCTILCGGGLP